ncbi:MAG: hypothetical protein ACK4NM_18535, partial [Hydrogenophaga sp.]
MLSAADAVRSDYEEERVLAELMEAERVRRRRQQVARCPPTYLTARERALFSFRANENARGTTDGSPALCQDLPPDAPCPPGCNCPRAVEEERRLIRPWTDAELIIFVDAFLRHPKDFPRVAQYLRNKCTA